MPKMESIVVIGAGSWGTALANLFSDAGCKVTLWARDPKQVAEINSQHQNNKYLPGHLLNPNLKASLDLPNLLKTSDLVVSAIPTQQIRPVLSPHKTLLDGKPVLNSAKGIEIGTHLCVSEIFGELAPHSPFAVLSGPSFAEEVVARLPAAVTLASPDTQFAISLQSLISNDYFRAYTSDDLAGVEIAGALKNIVAIATGIVNGLALGYNAQAAIINRGMAEMMRMGKKRGANPLTFLGLAGMGDLILTCTGPLSRNRRLGSALAKGRTLEQAQREIGGVAEGYYTARSAKELAAAIHVEMPITEQIYRILYEQQSPRGALVELMSRDLKSEW